MHKKSPTKTLLFNLSGVFIFLLILGFVSLFNNPITVSSLDTDWLSLSFEERLFFALALFTVIVSMYLSGFIAIRSAVFLVLGAQLIHYYVSADMAMHSVFGVIISGGVLCGLAVIFLMRSILKILLSKMPISEKVAQSLNAKNLLRAIYRVLLHWLNTIIWNIFNSKTFKFLHSATLENDLESMQDKRHFQAAIAENIRHSIASFNSIKHNKNASQSSNERETIIFCYQSLLNTLDEYSYIRADSATAREFSQTLIELDFPKEIIEPFTQLFEQAKYQSHYLTVSDSNKPANAQQLLQSLLTFIENKEVNKVC
jgi:hypothetical protein